MSNYVALEKMETLNLKISTAMTQRLGEENCDGGDAWCNYCIIVHSGVELW